MVLATVMVTVPFLPGVLAHADAHATNSTNTANPSLGNQAKNHANGWVAGGMREYMQVPSQLLKQSQCEREKIHA